MTTGARQAGGRRAPAGDVDEGVDGAEQHDVEAHDETKSISSSVLRPEPIPGMKLKPYLTTSQIKFKIKTTCKHFYGVQSHISEVANAINKVPVYGIRADG